jgi:hypothetical protein
MNPSRALRLAAAIALSCAVALACQSGHSSQGRLARGWLASEHPPLGAAGNGSALSPEEKAAIELLHEYEDAHRSRDVSRLARVWAMDPFQRVLMGRLFRDQASMPVSVRPLELRRSASELVVDFDQTSPRLGRGAGLPFRARLLQRRGGEWVIYGLGPRRDGVRGVAEAQAAPPRADTPGAAIREFQEAFGARDVERLSAVWLMGAEERVVVEDVFARGTDTAFGVEVLGVEVSGDRAIVDFDQLPQRTGLDRLRARIEQAPDGRWVIGSIQHR